MKTVCILLLLFFPYFFSFAQKEATHWYFGDKAGLAFTTNPPTLLTNSQMVTQDGCAVMSDKETGELLFYTNGRNIWNKDHQLMPNGQDFPPDCPSVITQSALIVPVPESDTRYYVFSILYTPHQQFPPLDNCVEGYYFPSFEYSCYIQYSLIDMQLEAGKGDVVTDRKNILLQTNATEKLTAIPHSNGKDYWLLTHEWNSDAFYVYLISASGISQPNIMHIGSVHEVEKRAGLIRNDQIRGNLKASPDGRRLACAVSSRRERPFDLFDFDPQTGQIFNYVNLGNLSGQYGVSFSPDNSKLYVSTDSPHGVGQPYKDIIRQYDLTKGTVAENIQSGQSIIRDNPYTHFPGQGTFEGFGHWDVGLQIGLDGKIYATSNNGVTGGSPENGIMVIIHQPNVAGYECRVSYERFDFRTGGVCTGLPNFIQSYFNNIIPINPDETCPATEITLSPNPTSQAVHVQISDACHLPFTLRIVNAIGQEVGPEYTNLKQSATVDLTGLADGMYLFILTFPNNQVVKKMIKIR